MYYIIASVHKYIQLELSLVQLFLISALSLNPFLMLAFCNKWLYTLISLNNPQIELHMNSLVFHAALCLPLFCPKLIYLPCCYFKCLHSFKLVICLFSIITSSKSWLTCYFHKYYMVALVNYELLRRDGAPVQRNKLLWLLESILVYAKLLQCVGIWRESWISSYL